MSEESVKGYQLDAGALTEFSKVQKVLDEVIVECGKCNSATCIDAQEGFSRVFQQVTSAYALHLSRGCRVEDISLRPTYQGGRKC